MTGNASPSRITAPIGRAVTYYRTTFHVTEAMRSTGALFVAFKGVDYTGHVFINGTFLGTHEGFFAPFAFEFTPAAHVGENVLLVKVENDAVPISDGGSWGMSVDGDKLYAATGRGWDDPEVGWHHCPPGMGIYQSVTIEARPTLHLTRMCLSGRCSTSGVPMRSRYITAPPPRSPSSSASRCLDRTSR